VHHVETVETRSEGGLIRHDIPDNVAELVEQHGSLRKAAAALGIPFSTLQYRRAQEIVAHGVPVAGPDELEYPDLPSSELSPAELIEQAAKRFASRQAARDARRWMEIKVKSNAPIGVVIVGDPHVDNPGANWPLLREHISIMERTPGLYAIGGNDITDNWVGRLARLYDDSDMTKKAAWKLAVYLLKETKIRWRSVFIALAFGLCAVRRCPVSPPFMPITPVLRGNRSATRD
jgi:hypothetical protein